MRKVEVLGVRVEMPTNQPIVLLKEVEGERFLPIWIGAAEASAIAYAQQGVVPPRPLTHDLFTEVLEVLGHELTRVQIVRLEDKVFFAELLLDAGTIVSARPSDAIALALRTGATITVADDVLDAASITMPAEEDDEVEKFRQFLDEVSAEDFLPDKDTPLEGF
ncbi:MAG: bifunctional nuclease family protein [Candidatus Lutibacillus vidarii]|nr:bifunctional nuclease family protein [Candidatus Lutibacillus vidarii]HON74239.1 bifunctional nuclease family protein [Dermatophilaceae bacterium]HRB99236.1 bifunctional nuclease family protein [Dermatophilaceae bacterium]